MKSLLDNAFAICEHPEPTLPVSPNLTFNYSQQKVAAKEFTMTFHFNFYDIEFLLSRSKVLEVGTLPTIIQRI